MLEVGFKTYYDRFILAARASKERGDAEKTAEKLLSYSCNLLLDEEADGKLKLIRSICEDGYIYFEVEPFDFSLERFSGIKDALVSIISAFSEEYPGEITVE